MKLKAYIDHLLALVLESHSSLLEGMPRIQQSCGIRLELLAAASLPEVRGHSEPPTPSEVNRWTGSLARGLYDLVNSTKLLTWPHTSAISGIRASN